MLCLSYVVSVCLPACLSVLICYCVAQAVDMYAGAGKWAAAHKVAMGYLSEQEINVRRHTLLQYCSCVPYKHALSSQVQAPSKSNWYWVWSLNDIAIAMLA